jgi:hypothetical protein
VTDVPDVIEMESAAAVVDVPDTLIRRPLASCDPEFLVLYERLVIARQGSRGALRNALLDREVALAKQLGRIDELIDNAQRIAEALQ